MKKLIIIIAIIISNTLVSTANNYNQVMGETIQKMYQSQEAELLTEIANTFNRIGEKEKEQWLPYYYASYSYTSILFQTQNLNANEKNSYLDKAQKQLDKALEINSTESEIHTLQGLIYQLRITDPSLGYKYSTLANTSLGKAIQLNKNNPRAYYIKAMGTFHTPSEYGGGASMAKSLFEKAKTLFENTTIENRLLPTWGKEQNEMFLNKCE